MEAKQGKPANEEQKSENGKGESQSAPLLRPSAFHPPQHNATPGILAPSRLGNPLGSRGFGTPQAAPGPGDNPLSHNPFAAKLSALSPDTDGLEGGSQSKFVLRPSALDRQTANFNKESNTSSSYKSSFKLEPAKLQSPFQQKSGKSPETDKDKSSGSPERGNSLTNDGADGAQSEEVKQRLFGAGGATDSAATPGESATEKKNEGASGFIFGQNMETRVTSALTPSVTSSMTSESGGQPNGKDGKPGFVFGEKLEDRVDKEAETTTTTTTTASCTTTSEKENTTNDPAAEVEKEEKSTDAVSDDKEEDTEESKKSLAESAALHQAKRSRPELQKVEVKTGEEDESNVFQVNVKLFVFEKETHSWLERGRGLLRLNDMCASDTQSFQSRLVMRTAGSLRVVLNTKIWPEMMIERASPKSLRISAMDAEEGVKIYLIMANLKDAEQIFSAIDSRVSQLRLQEDKESREGKEPREGREGKAAGGSEKRRQEAEETAPASKKIRVDPEQRRDVTTEESNDSSTVDPETEGDPASSNESFTSSPTIKSSSSEA